MNRAARAATGKGRLVQVLQEIAAGNTNLELLEREAPEAKGGLWADPNPLLAFRKPKRGQFVGAEDLIALDSS